MQRFGKWRGQEKSQNLDWNRPKDDQPKRPFIENQKSNTIRNDREEQRCFRYDQKDYFKRNCIAGKFYIYHEEETNENVNIR